MCNLPAVYYPNNNNISIVSNTSLLAKPYISGDSPITFSSPNLPSGMFIDIDTGNIGGIAIDPVGIYLVDVVASNACGVITIPVIIQITSSCQPVMISINPNYTLSQGTYSTINIGYSGSLNVLFDINPLLLPLGMNLNTGSGVISGIPAVSGTYSFTVTATNACGSTTSDSVITVLAQASSCGGITVSPQSVSINSGGYQIVTFTSATQNPTFSSSCQEVTPELIATNQDIVTGCYQHIVKVSGINASQDSINCTVCLLP